MPGLGLIDVSKMGPCGRGVQELPSVISIIRHNNDNVLLLYVIVLKQSVPRPMALAQGNGMDYSGYDDAMTWKQFSYFCPFVKESTDGH